MVNANDFTPFFGNLDKKNEDKQEQADFQKKLMGIIATDKGGK